MTTLNLGILAHVDAGKTSLTERLLHTAGVIDEIGSVDEGSTQTDTLDLERRRGITIKSAVVSFVANGVTVNLIDTPGHPDFIAEVERALGVLDGAVLVISAVEGVQAQTRVLMRALQRLSIPTLLFVNKIDRMGARYDGLLSDIARRLTPAIAAMGTVSGLGGGGAEFAPHDPALEVLAEHDDDLLAAYVDGEGASPHRLHRALARQTRECLVHPVYFGSALTGAGVGELIDAITGLLPSAGGDPSADTSGLVFKVERGLAYVRMFDGAVRVRQRLSHGTVTGIEVFEHGGLVRRPSVEAGQIAKLSGLRGVRIGDTVGVAPARASNGGNSFAPPTLEAVVVPDRPVDRGPLFAALTELAEQDPLIGLRRDEFREEISVSLYGEVQKEVIQATLEQEFGIGASFQETTTVYIERPRGAGAAAEFMGGDNPFRAAVGLCVEPGAVGSGVQFRLGIEPGALPMAFVRAVEESARRTLRQGLHGWEVTDCAVTLTHSGYTPPPPYGWSKWSSSGGDFRHLTPLVLMAALRAAGTTMFEPIHRVRLELPADALGAVMPVLARLGGVAESTHLDRAPAELVAQLPATRVHELQQLLPSLTRGEGVLDGAFSHYRQVQGQAPVRPRSDHNPLDRKEYLLHVVRRV